MSLASLLSTNLFVIPFWLHKVCKTPKIYFVLFKVIFHKKDGEVARQVEDSRGTPLSKLEKTVEKQRLEADEMKAQIKSLEMTVELLANTGKIHLTEQID